VTAAGARRAIAILALVSGCVLPTKAPRERARCGQLYRVETTIAASPARVWSVLADLPAYREWNPWLRSAVGRLVPGAGVRARVVLGKEVRTADHVVLVVEPERRLCWRDAGWTTIFVYAQRCRWLAPSPEGGVRFVQELQLEGAFSALAQWMYGPALEAGIVAETEALRLRAEAPDPAWARRKASATIAR
jgi:uncharacterized protein YndB with AHSA1/START domain